MENERKNKIEYHKEGDYYVPNLVVPKYEYPDYCIGKYGRTIKIKIFKGKQESRIYNNANGRNFKKAHCRNRYRSK